MQDETRRREARMMEAVAGLGGRNAMSGEVDIRLGVELSTGGCPGWIIAMAGVLQRLALAKREDGTMPTPVQTTIDAAP